jgi:hypothetical protein
MEEDALKLDRTAFSVTSLENQSDEMEYWLSISPSERVAAIELMRQIIYGSDPAITRLQRVFEVTQPKPQRIGQS